MMEAQAKVTTRGEAVVPGRPDEGIWSIEVDALADVADAALAEVTARSRDLEAVLDEIEVPKEKRSTSGVTVREEFDYGEGKQVRRGFRALNVVTVRLADPSTAGRLIEDAVGRARASVRGPSWWIAPDNPARLEACRAAAAEAARKAEAYAQALGLRLGAVIEVREPPAGPVPLPRPGARAIALSAAADASLEVDPGELDVHAQVEITFALESGG
jgi:uncharacterized protein YggE